MKLMWCVFFEMLSAKVEIFLTFKFVKLYFTKYKKTGIEYDVCSWIIMLKSIGVLPIRILYRV